jgi:hypothetical protein
MISLVYDFDGSPEGPFSVRRSKALGKVPERSARASDVDCAAREVVAARAATHSAIALRSAPSGGNTYLRMSGQ